MEVLGYQHQKVTPFANVLCLQMSNKQKYVVFIELSEQYRRSCDLFIGKFTCTGDKLLTVLKQFSRICLPLSLLDGFILE